MATNDEILDAVGRLRAWIRDYGHLKEPQFIADLDIVLDAAESAAVAANPTKPLAPSQLVPLSTEVYQWIGFDGGFKIGRRVELPATCGAGRVLMWNGHSGGHELVDESAIKPYPSEPIEEP